MSVLRKYVVAIVITLFITLPCAIYTVHAVFEIKRINRETTAINERTEQILRDRLLSPKHPELAPIPYEGGTRYYEPPVPAVAGSCAQPYRYADAMVTFVVPEGRSIWSCLTTQFGGMSEKQLVESIGNLADLAVHDPNQLVRDIDVVPVGYTFYTDLTGSMAAPAPAYLQPAE